jgi:phosphate transport system protein
LSNHFVKEISKLNTLVTYYSETVKEVMDNTVKALVKRDMDLARGVLEGDPRLDEKKVEIEEEVLKILALYQPVASDLRYIVAILKLNSDLERIADLCGNICQINLRTEGHSDLKLAYDLEKMAARVKKLIKKSLRALIEADKELALEVLAKEERIDRIHDENYKATIDMIVKNSDAEHVELYSMMASVSSYFERIGNHATNIAEDVIYMVDGTIEYTR